MNVWSRSLGWCCFLKRISSPKNSNIVHKTFLVSKQCCSIRLNKWSRWGLLRKPQDPKLTWKDIRPLFEDEIWVEDVNSVSSNRFGILGLPAICITILMEPFCGLCSLGPQLLQSFSFCFAHKCFCGLQFSLDFSNSKKEEEIIPDFSFSVGSSRGLWISKSEQVQSRTQARE